jgi:hypothetical protein
MEAAPSSQELPPEAVGDAPVNPTPASPPPSCMIFFEIHPKTLSGSFLNAPPPSFLVPAFIPFDEFMGIMTKADALVNRSLAEVRLRCKIITVLTLLFVVMVSVLATPTVCVLLLSLPCTKIVYIRKKRLGTTLKLRELFGGWDNDAVRVLVSSAIVPPYRATYSFYAALKNVPHPALP